MNRSRKMHTILPSLLLSECIDGFFKYKTAEGLSVRTVSSYEWTLQKWLEHFEDRPIGKVTSVGYCPHLRESGGYGYRAGASKGESSR